MPEPQQYKLTPRQKRMLSDYKQRQHVSARSVQQSVSEINSIESLYKALSARDGIKAKALLMLMLRSWLTEVSYFDPVSGHALRTGIVDFLDAVAKSMNNESHERETKDRIYRIVSHTKDAILAILEHARDKILREHAMLPIHAAREVDSNSVQWLSRKPGRTLREKLSDKPYIRAVRRRFSGDTSENRLLKAFLLRLEQILVERQNALHAPTEVTCEELLVSLQRWLRSKEASDIGAWGNLPPNNILLQDRRYRKVWDGWLWLQGIDVIITKDRKRIQRDILNVIYWETLSLLNHTGRFRMVQQPVCPDYENFTISHELPIRGYLFLARDSKIKGRIKRIHHEREYGFLTTESGADFFFHKNNLSDKLDINSLKAGDTVSFVIGSNRQGDCADDIQLTTGPEPVHFSLSDDKFDIRVGEKEFSLSVEADHLFLIQKPEDTKKKFQLKPTTVKELPRAIISWIAGTSFDNLAVDDNESDLVRMDVSIVDLCSIRPRFTNNTGAQAFLPFRLLQQHWPSNINRGLAIDCGRTKAIALQADIETVSMRSLFSHNSTLSDAVKSSASMFFTKKLSDYIPVDRLTYLVPDWGNEFDLECIRRSVNFYFDDSTPLPKSIAAIFAWQSSKRFVQDRVRENDFVLVIDSFDGGVSMTPVQAIYQKKLSEILPESHGTSWERHPTVIVENRNIYTGMVRNLDQDGCQISEELIQLFGFDGLINDAEKISFVNNDNWYHLSGSIRDVLNQDLDENMVSNHTISNCMSSINRDCRGVNIFILPLDDTIKNHELGLKYNWLGSAWSPIKGCQTLYEWQKMVSDIALWRDHLPELSIRIVRDGHYENFYLVKDETVTPQRGRTVDIPVRGSFTLPAGQPFYSFPLLQGKGSKELQFVAYLKSPAFPLKEDTACKLQMTYTYGADNPYDLKFIPLDSACTEFKSIRVEWRSATEMSIVDPEKLPVPVFPASKSWSDFQRFPKEDGASFSNLLDWCCSTLDNLSLLLSFDYDRELRTLLNMRKVGQLEWGANDRNGKYYCRVNVDGKSVFCHSSQFVEPADESTLYEGCPVYLDILTNEKGLYGSKISFSGSLPPTLREELDKVINRKRSNYIEFIKKGVFNLRFPVLTIWNNGHSLAESDVPDQFRNAILKGTNETLSIIESEDVPEELKKELFFFLSCLHKDAPGIVGNRLLDAVKDKRLLRRDSRNIAFAVGNAELPWQQELLGNIISPIDNEGLTRSITMEILSIALWRSKELISRMTEKELIEVSINLFRCIQFDIQQLTEVKERRYQTATLCKHLELLLALLRTRGSEDGKIGMLLAPNKELTKRYVTLIDDVSRVVIDNAIDLRSRISLQIEKPEMFRNTPDLLYALRMFLTADSGANTISISGIRDDEEGQ